MNELSQIINGTNVPLNITLTSATNWTQFIMSALLVLISSFGILVLFYIPRISFGGSLSKLSKLSKRNIVMIKHTQQGLFGGSMIDQQCLTDMSKIMNKMDGEPFDLILHTPGGDIFSSLAISRILNQYPGAIRAIIPLYSMSGGSLLALSCKEVLMTSNASIGPIDPQLGNLFKYGSARGWEEIVKFKGKKAEDQSISFAMIGKQYTKSIQSHLNKVINFNLNNKQKTKLITFLTDGKIEHAYPLTNIDLTNFGIETKILTDKKYLKVLNKIISSSSKEGVSYYKLSKWRKKCMKSS